MPFRDYVEETFLETNEVPKHLESYIDYDAVARDWELGGDFWTVSDGMGNDYIFRSY
jgi:antirestriction protein